MNGWYWNIISLNIEHFVIGTNTVWIREELLEVAELWKRQRCLRKVKTVFAQKYNHHCELWTFLENFNREAVQSVVHYPCRTYKSFVRIICVVHTNNLVCIICVVHTNHLVCIISVSFIQTICCAYLCRSAVEALLFAFEGITVLLMSLFALVNCTVWIAHIVAHLCSLLYTLLHTLLNTLLLTLLLMSLFTLWIAPILNFTSNTLLIVIIQHFWSVSTSDLAFHH